MNSIRNSVMLIGHLGKDPEIRTLQNGNMFAKLSLATNEIYRKTNGDKVTSTYWHNCIAWGKRAELINNLLKKGKEVAIRGKLTYNSYEDKNGIMRYRPQIVVNEFVLLK